LIGAVISRFRRVSGTAALLGTLVKVEALATQS
jgi:hypothetical protein